MALRPFIGGKATLWLPVPTGGVISVRKAVYGLPPGGFGCATHQPHEPVDHEGGYDFAAAVVPRSVVYYALLIDWVFALDEMDI